MSQDASKLADSKLEYNDLLQHYEVAIGLCATS